MSDETWTLSELAAQVAAVLRGYDAASNGQIRAVPDERAIRYYTTLGLIDRPDAMRGRTALYGKRHLAQLVAIKRLQSAGKSLAEIATIVPTLGDATLTRVSGIALPKRAAPASGRADFWRSAPVAPAAPAAHAAPARDVAVAARSAEASFATRLVLEVAPGVTITIDAARAAEGGDAEAVRRAARPIVEELRQRGLISVADGLFEPKEREEEPR